MSILVKYVYAQCVWKRFKETPLKIFTFPGSLNVGDKIYALIEPRLADVWLWSELEKIFQFIYVVFIYLFIRIFMKWLQ